MIQNKKRKHEVFEHDDDDGMIDDDNMESVLFNEMTSVNSQLISLAGNVKLMNSNYFRQNNEMINEFIQNIHEFLKIFAFHEKKVFFSQLGSDNLFNIFQFLDSPTLVHHCRFVCKSWKEVFNRIGFSVRLISDKRTKQLINSSHVRYVTELKMDTKEAEAFKILSTCKTFDSLQTLDLCGNTLGSTAMSHLCKCSFPNLTELNFRPIVESSKKFPLSYAQSLFNREEIMSKIKKLYVSHYNLMDFKELLEIISKSKYLKQLSHFKVSIEGDARSLGLNSCLKEMKELQYLEANHYTFFDISDVISSGNFMNLTFLDISGCSIKNSVFADLIVSPNLPKLATLHAVSLNGKDQDDTEIDLSLNTQPKSCLTDLDLRYTNIIPFPSLANYCSNLKTLSLKTINHKSKEKAIATKKAICALLSSPNLSNLRRLTSVSWKQVWDIVFTSPIYSKLEFLDMCAIANKTRFSTSIISDCKNLVNLKSLRLDQISVTDIPFNNNPTFAKLQEIKIT